MLLTIDIGNSSTKFGWFEAESLVKKISIDTIRNQTASDIYSQIETSAPKKTFAIIISSVVKELKNTYTLLCKQNFNIEPFFADHAFDFGFQIKYFPPEDCGSDRLVDAFATVEKYGVPSIVCDFGTATTIDLVDENREYLGGIITPGISTLASALFDKTSKLPKVALEKPSNIVGNSTINSIQSGIYFGYIGLVDGIIERIISETNSKPNVISTGGFADLIAKESKFVRVVEGNLMLDGLRLIYEKRKLKES